PLFPRLYESQPISETWYVGVDFHIASSYRDAKICFLSGGFSGIGCGMPQPDPTDDLKKSLSERILVLDGAMGTTIRTYGLQEKDARGERFANTDKDLLNNGDI